MTEKRKRGRPKSANFEKREKLRKAIEEYAPQIIEQLFQAAQSGDIGASTALLDRAIPKLKPASMAVYLDLGEPKELHEKLLDAVCSAKLPVDIGLQIAALAEKAQAQAPTAFKPIDEGALNALYEKAMAQSAADSKRVANRRAEDLLLEVKDDE